jgi:hypothetical protein
MVTASTPIAASPPSRHATAIAVALAGEDAFLQRESVFDTSAPICM